ncbi:class I SAM-dependent methyltransferase [Denitrobacterium detoxificans]|uniref:Ribosomal RNA small subunit methyltransferase J n=1 Tax=Denitrobacterium detoxificans TaxID=79604 RepID=A0A1H8TS68_9ACTN|nr:class I SAM-dependent methyltransferase [Denitrobacterium detoxificans]SEO93484.1 16S rRNA (guanine1516-N2)-methyltransferase [Denitrobacterium detoxificans]
METPPCRTHFAVQHGTTRYTGTMETPKTYDIAVRATLNQYDKAARELAEHLGVPYLAPNASETPAATLLTIDEAGMALVSDGMTMRVDLSHLARRLHPSKVHCELLVRAAKLKGVTDPVALDATAGLGEDAMLLAAAGFTVYAYEANPIIAALLADTIARAAKDPACAQAAERMHVIEGDSIQALAEGRHAPDVVYLDPMFPERTKSAAVKKKFQLLHHLERPCENQDELLQAALASHPRKVVIKRPVKGPYLADRKPSYSLAGKAVRYDCIALPSVVAE